MSLFDLVGGDMVTDADRMLPVESDLSRALCVFCRDRITEPWIVYPTHCEAAHKPVRDGMCGLEIAHRNHRLFAVDSMERYGDKDTQGNCFAKAHNHHYERKSNGWFGYGKLPLECLQQEVREIDAWLAEHAVKERAA